ncbi:MAG: AbrB/MazE/SpoVT family DNA-binding domain-containing protein [Clostridia bacterium]|nr:AbrB/MazE/SpoVT family DNA-binding domain-containing protein [Oscillospiraceae bacterium]MBR4893408.1 AbrB/MazE/SpoVT family DNA-binding domain-containing protein [Clostridia bacterium]
MKATGIVRRIDDLGRVVIPKEIRRTMRIQEGDPLEIYTNNEGAVLFKKYSQVGDISEFADEYAQAINDITGYVTVVTDKDNVVSACGIPKKELVGKNLSYELREIIDDRMTYGYVEGEESVNLIDSTDKYKVSLACPVVCMNEPVGMVGIIFPDLNKKLGETEEKIAQTSATVLGKIIEN